MQTNALASAARSDPSDLQAEEGIAPLMGLFGKVLQSGDAPEDLNISMASLDKEGNPIESQRVGNALRDSLPPIPHTPELYFVAGLIYRSRLMLRWIANLSPAGIAALTS